MWIDEVRSLGHDVGKARRALTLTLTLTLTLPLTLTLSLTLTTWARRAALRPRPCGVVTTEPGARGRLGARARVLGVGAERAARAAQLGRPGW